MKAFNFKLQSLLELASTGLQDPTSDPSPFRNPRICLSVIGHGHYVGENVPFYLLSLLSSLCSVHVCSKLMIDNLSSNFRLTNGLLNRPLHGWTQQVLLHTAPA